MKGSDAKLVSYMQGSHKRFIIRVYDVFVPLLRDWQNNYERIN